MLFMSVVCMGLGLGLDIVCVDVWMGGGVCLGFWCVGWDGMVMMCEWYGCDE